MYTNIRVPFEGLQEDWCQPLEREINFASKMKKPKSITKIKGQDKFTGLSGLQSLMEHARWICTRLNIFKCTSSFGQCPICLEDMYSAARTTDCAHIFHSHCLRKSLEVIGDSCPMCRNPILDSLLSEEERYIQDSEFAYWHQQM